MALIDKASLLMVPSTYEAGTLYNVLPSGNRAPDSTDQNSGYDQTRADFSFDRGSNAAATRVNADGLIEKYRENLLTESNNFSDSDWIKYNSNVTSGQEGYDGSSNAWLFEATSAGGQLIQSISLGGVHTASVYAKAGTADGIRLRIDQTSDANAYVNLLDGSVRLQTSTIDIDIQDVSNGWYRITYAFNGSNAVGFYLYPTDGDTTSSAGNILIQNAQLEVGLVATDYLDSGATTAKAGVLIDLPRINYDANGENGSLLLEPQRANLIEYSEYFNDSTHAKYYLSVSDNAGTSPEGVVNAAKLIPTTANNGHYMDNSNTTSAGVTYTFSCFVKADGYNYVNLNIGASRLGVIVDLTDGSIINTYNNVNSYINPDSDVVDYGNGWYRVIITGESVDGSGGYGRIAVYETSSSSNVQSFAGDGVSGILVYGMQWEASASYPTSYIPNHGTSGGVTRAADSCTNTSATSVIGQTEGTMYVEFDWEQKSGVYFVSDLSTGSTSNEILIAIGNTADNRIRFQIQNSGVDQVNFNTSAISSGTHKVALAYKANDVVAYLDGVQVVTDTSATIPATSQYRLERANGTLGFSGGIKQTMLFDTRLTNSELATLTTL